jgi:hypothetical protein
MFGFFQKKTSRELHVCKSGYFGPKQETRNGLVETMTQAFITLAAEVDDGKLLKPVYISWIKTEKDAETNSPLPLIYLWNEDPQAGTFTVTVNGRQVASLLETLLPREHAEFVATRDNIMTVLAKSSTAAVVAACERTGLLPSLGFSL